MLVETGNDPAQPAAAPSTTPHSPHQGQRPLKILIVAINYAPEMVGCAKYTSELATFLARQGHQLEVVCAPPYYPSWQINSPYSGWNYKSDNISGIKINRTPLYVPQKPSGIKRILHLVSFGIFAVPSTISAGLRMKPDLVFAVAPTLTSAISAWLAAKISGSKTWLHIQDFEVDAAFELGLLKNNLARKVATITESLIFDRFDRISSISPAMVNLLKSKGIKSEKTFELRNWVDLENFPVLESSYTQYRKDLNIGKDDIVALYSGNMANKQGIESLSQVAELALKSDKSIKFVICGDGPAKDSLVDSCKGLGNTIFLPLQPMERLPELLGTADIHLLPQRPEAADLVLPSKLTGMLASGRPTIAMAEQGTGLADEIAGCGIAVAPNATAMAEAIDILAKSPVSRAAYGANARVRALERWQQSEIISKFETEISAMVS